MSFIELTGKDTETGQYIDVKRGRCSSVDIFLREGRIHIDGDDADVLRRRLYELKEI